jgi:hypothetical protein
VRRVGTTPRRAIVGALTALTVTLPFVWIARGVLPNLTLGNNPRIADAQHVARPLLFTGLATLLPAAVLVVVRTSERVPERSRVAFTVLVSVGVLGPLTVVHVQAERAWAERREVQTRLRRLTVPATWHLEQTRGSGYLPGGSAVFRVTSSPEAACVDAVEILGALGDRSREASVPIAQGTPGCRLVADDGDWCSSIDIGVDPRDPKSPVRGIEIDTSGGTIARISRHVDDPCLPRRS